MPWFTGHVGLDTRFWRQVALSDDLVWNPINREAWGLPEVTKPVASCKLFKACNYHLHPIQTLFSALMNTFDEHVHHTRTCGASRLARQVAASAYLVLPTGE